MATVSRRDAKLRTIPFGSSPVGGWEQILAA